MQHLNLLQETGGFLGIIWEEDGSGGKLRGFGARGSREGHYKGRPQRAGMRGIIVACSVNDGNFVQNECSMRDYPLFECCSSFQNVLRLMFCL